MPVFHRWPQLALIARVFTAGMWPKKNIHAGVVDGKDVELPDRTYFSLFGYPVRNTGIEKPALFLLLILILQMIPFPHALTRLLSPDTAHIYEQAYGAAGAEPGWHPFSLDSFLTFSKFLEYSAYFMIYLVVQNGSPSGRYHRTILATFLLSAAFQAGYGLYEFLTNHHYIFFYEKTVNREYATGTFINRNHYAAYLAMAVPLIFGIIAGYFTPLSRKENEPALSKLAIVLKMEGGKILLLLFIFGLIAPAIICSMSRGGILSVFIASFVFLALYVRSNKRASRAPRWLGLLLLGSAIVAIATWEPLHARFEQMSEQFTARRARTVIYADTARIFLSFPLTGAGAGTFMQVFPAHRSFVAYDVYRYAHNDYLQLLAETGIAGLIFIAMLSFAIFSRLARILMRAFGKTSVFQIGSFCSILTLALHSVTEFPLQIPAIVTSATILSVLFMRTPSVK